MRLRQEVQALLRSSLTPRQRRLPSALTEIDGVAVKIGRGADAGMIAAVIEALKATR